MELIAGIPEHKGDKDGIGLEAMFNCPSGIAISEQSGDVYVADSGNHVIRKINAQGDSSSILTDTC